MMFSETLNIFSYENTLFTQEETQLLFADCDVIRVPEGKVLYKVGEKSAAVYCLIKGTTKYEIPISNRTNPFVAFSSAPSYLGILNLFPEEEAISCCSAVTACEIAVCPSELFLKRVEQHGLTKKLLYLSLKTSRHIHSAMIEMTSGR